MYSHSLALEFLDKEQKFVKSIREFSKAYFNSVHLSYFIFAMFLVYRMILR